MLVIAPYEKNRIEYRILLGRSELKKTITAFTQILSIAKAVMMSEEEKRFCQWWVERYGRLFAERHGRLFAERHRRLFVERHRHLLLITQQLLKNIKRIFRLIYQDQSEDSISLAFFSMWDISFAHRYRALSFPLLFQYIQKLTSVYVSLNLFLWTTSKTYSLSHIVDLEYTHHQSAWSVS